MCGASSRRSQRERNSLLPNKLSRFTYATICKQVRVQATGSLVSTSKPNLLDKVLKSTSRPRASLVYFMLPEPSHSRRIRSCAPPHPTRVTSQHSAEHSASQYNCGGQDPIPCARPCTKRCLRFLSVCAAARVQSKGSKRDTKGSSPQPDQGPGLAPSQLVQHSAGPGAQPHRGPTP
jgi:hypothetical protein